MYYMFRTTVDLILITLFRSSRLWESGRFSDSPFSSKALTTQSPFCKFKRWYTFFGLVGIKLKLKRSSRLCSRSSSSLAPRSSLRSSLSIAGKGLLKRAKRQKSASRPKLSILMRFVSILKRIVAMKCQKSCRLMG
jgi:hypothetical protein